MTSAVINSIGRKLVVTVACLLLAACAAQPELNNPPDGTPAETLQDQGAAEQSARLDREKAITAYRDYLARYPDSPEFDRITRRLADLLVEQAADLQLEAATALDDSRPLKAAAMEAYAEAINRYEYLLNKYPDGPETTDLLYQLSRAYDESGKSQQALGSIERLLAQEPAGNTRLYADTRFRQGEILFSEASYLEAGQCYQAVVDLGASVPAYEQSLYKLGWSLFKQGRYTDALPVLFAFLDLKIAADETLDAQLARLSPADREQLADVFRVINMSLAQLAGVDSLGRFFRETGRRSYEELVYLGLAEF